MDTSSADNAVTTLVQLLKILKANVTPSTVKYTVESHPEFPTLRSISDALDRWHVTNAAFQLGSVEQLRELPLPFVVHLRQQGGWFRIVKNFEQDKLTYWDSEIGVGYNSLEEFEQNWSGIVLIAETDADSGEAEYPKMRRKELLRNARRPALYLLTVFALSLIFSIRLSTLTLLDSGWLLTKTVGLALSIALLAKQFGSHNLLINRICRINANTSCQSLLDSPAAKLWGWLSWAEIGAIYFAGSLCTVLFGSNPLLGWLALCALPYTFFSVYYQARVVHTWCPLCMAVQGVLLIEGALSLTQSLLPITLVNVTYVALSFGLSLIGWILLEPMLKTIQVHHLEHHNLMAFKSNSLVFNTLIKSQELMPTIPKQLHPVRLDNPNAKHFLTIISNPYCGPCSALHKELDALLNQFPSIGVQLIFLTSEATDDRVTQLAQHLLKLEQNLVHTALTTWFSQPQADYKTWARKYPVKVENDYTVQMAIDHGRWCRSVGISTTPTVFLDGYRFPELYKLTDIDWQLSNNPKESASLI